MDKIHGDVIVNELLFFIQNKIHATTKDTIVETCVKFYSLDEITGAISVLESSLKIRLSKRNKSDDLHSKLLNDLYEKIWTMDAANTQIPKFAALDLSRIPREKENSESLVSNEQLLATVHSLKTAVSFLRETHEQLDSSLATCANLFHPSASSATSVAPPLSYAASAAIASAASRTSSTHASASLPLASAPDLSLARYLPTAPPAPLSPSAPHTLDNSPAISLSKKQQKEVVERQREKMPRSQRPAGKQPASRGKSLVIGKKVNAGVVSWKGADLMIAKYIGRCALGTTTNDIKATLDFHGVEIVSLEPVPTKHQRFASFKLVAKKSQQEIVENGEIWPEGVLVGRWWPPKSSSALSDSPVS